MQVKVYAKVKVFIYKGIYSPAISAYFTSIIPWLQLISCLSQSHLPGENAVHFLRLKTFTQYQFSFHLVPITVEWPEAVWIQSLPKVFTYEQFSGIEPQCPVLGSNALTTRPRAPHLSYVCLHVCSCIR